MANAIIYDKQLAAFDNADPTTVVRAGSIVIRNNEMTYAS